MNRNNPKHFIQKLSGIRLSESSRTSMREHLASYVDLHAVREPLRAAMPQQVSLFSWMRDRRFAYALALVLLVAVSGSSAAFAAEGTLPGDALYGVKIHVNEPLAKAFATTPTAKAHVSATLAERRVDEAATLAASGKLDDDKAAYLESEVRKEVDQTNTQADIIAAKGDTQTAADVRADLESRLTVHAAALAAASSDPEEADGAARVLAVVAERAHTVALARADASHEATSSAAVIATAADTNLSPIRAKAKTASVKANIATLSVPESDAPARVMLFSAAAKMDVSIEASSTASSTASTTASTTDKTDSDAEQDDAGGTDQNGIHEGLIPSLFFGFGSDGKNSFLPESIAPASAAR